MATYKSSIKVEDDYEAKSEQHNDMTQVRSVREGIVSENEIDDPVMHQKLLLVDKAMNEIGWTTYHLKLFFLCGFGYAVDSMAALAQSVVARNAYRGFGSTGYSTALTMSLYVGMVAGSVLFGFLSDTIGRRLAFNMSLFICSIATLVAGAMPNWASLAFFCSLIGFGAAGGVVMDPTIFLEFLPHKQRWLLTFLGLWFGIGQLLLSFIAWGFLAPTRFNCVKACTYDNNMGWRYVFYTTGGFILFLSILRIAVIDLQETPKYLLASKRDADLIKTLQYITEKYSRQCSLTLEQLEACGEVSSTHAKKRWTVGEILAHIRGLFVSKKLTLSTTMIWLSWTVTGIAGPLFFLFLPTYLAARGADFSESVSDTWRDYVLSNMSAIPGPIAAAYVLRIPGVGHKYSLAIGAALAMAFFFAYTTVRNAAQSLGFSCAISFTLFWYTGALFAYTTEVMPTAHRNTGYGIGYGINRLMGIVCAVIGSSVDLASDVPIYISAALFAVLIILSILMPFEPRKLGN